MGLLEDLWEELWMVSSQRKVITYFELRTKLFNRGYHIRSNFLGPYLLKIASDCTDNGIPIITALVVHEKKGIPNESYFIFQRLHRLPSVNDLQIWESERDAVWKVWS